MKCIHVIPGIAHEASGPSYSVPRLCEGLCEQGIDVELYASDRKPTKELKFPLNWYPPVAPYPYRLGRSPELYDALKHAVPKAQIVHNHSLWMMANVYPGWLAPRSRVCLVTSPRGTLSSWALNRSRLQKRLLWMIAQRRTVALASCLHATSEAEYTDIRRLGLKQPVAVIPNGYDIPALPKRSEEPLSPKRLLYLGRIHPVKGLDNLLLAWKHLGNTTKEWELHLVGPGERHHIDSILRLVSELRMPNVTLRGPVYGVEKSAEYVSADAYVLPSHSENFGMTVAEALAHGLPCLVSRCAPWSGLEKEQCGWWIENDTGCLVQALAAVMKLDRKVLRSMGERGRKWMERDYSWTAISERMVRIYWWLLVGGDRPSDICVE